jgi:putative (di)nucleoside polyphosphate hydrolase
MALTELARFLPRHENRGRFLRHGARGNGEPGERGRSNLPHIPLELPPGGSLERDLGTKPPLP